MKIIGIISDTHGLLRPEAVEGLAGSDMIIHAGDIGNPEILQTLGEIAPVTPVRGNMDFGAWADEISDTKVVEIGNLMMYVLHDLEYLDPDPISALFDIIVSGHTHRPAVQQKNGVWYVNPGSAGPVDLTCPLQFAGRY